MVHEFMDDEEQVFFKPLRSDDFLRAFEVYKEYLKPVVEAAIGWDEVYQKNGFNRRLQADGFHSVFLDDSQVGIVYFKNTERGTHLHLLIVFAEAQRQGIGSRATKKLQLLAHAQGRAMTLSCFKNNLPAVGLYKKLGFQVASEDEYFYDFISSSSLEH